MMPQAVDTYRDGGMLRITLTRGTFYVDARISSPTPYAVWYGYPDAKSAHARLATEAERDDVMHTLFMLARFAHKAHVKGVRFNECNTDVVLP